MKKCAYSKCGKEIKEDPIHTPDFGLDYCSIECSEKGDAEGYEFMFPHDHETDEENAIAQLIKKAHEQGVVDVKIVAGEERTHTYVGSHKKKKKWFNPFSAFYLRDSYMRCGASGGLQLSDMVYLISGIIL